MCFFPPNIFEEKVTSLVLIEKTEFWFFSGKFIFWVVIFSKTAKLANLAGNLKIINLFQCKTMQTFSKVNFDQLFIFICKVRNWREIQNCKVFRQENSIVSFQQFFQQRIQILNFESLSISKLIKDSEFPPKNPNFVVFRKITKFLSRRKLAGNSKSVLMCVRQLQN